MIEDRTIPCPTAESIRHYAAGGFDDQEAEQLEHHLLSCPQCETLLDGLDDPSDAIIQALSTLPATSDDETAYQELREAALARTAEFLGSADGAAQLQLANRLADPDLGPLPCRLGNYDLLACIGRGASGAVYRARHLKLEQISAVKVLDVSRSIDPDSFLQEIKTIGSLTHPNIVRATDAGEADGHHFLVMEYVDGIDAARLLFRNGPLRVADACEIVRQTALGLQFVHERGLIHRDIKPSNLLVTVGGEVKLLDLGIATRLNESPSDDDNQARPQGTLDYMAPEAWINPASIDSRSDLFSLGCTLYKLLAGRVPPREGDLEFHTLPPIPRALQQLLQKLLAKDPKHRPTSMQAVIDVLRPSCKHANLPALIAKTSPQLAELVSAKQTVPADQKNDRIQTRRAVLAGAAAVGAAAFLLPRLRHYFFPTLRRVVWRPLEPMEPTFLLAKQDSAAMELLDARADGYTLSSDKLTLLNMGRPVNGLFSLAVDLVPQETPGCGVFFRGQFDYSQASRSFAFQTVELLSANDSPADADGEFHLQWNQWHSREQDGALQFQQTPLAEAVVQLASSTSTQSLQVTCGRQGMPEIVWNREPVHETLWHLTAEGHALQRLSTGLLPTTYLGRVGLISTQGTTTFHRPRLAYL